MTWIEVASDAVKIGLGAIVGGVFALIGSAHAHKHKLAQEYSRRRRDTLETIATDFDRIALIGMERAVTWVTLQGSGQKKRPSKLERDLANDLLTDTSGLNALYELHAIEAKLALLAFPHIAEAVQEYRALFSQIDVDGALTRESAGTIESALHAQRTIVITLMAQAFQNA